MIDDVVDLGGFTGIQEIVLDLGGEGFAALAAKDEEERGELVAIQEELEGVIELMDEGLRTDFAFHGALFAVDEFVLDLFPELGVAVSNIFELGQVVAVDLFLEYLLGWG